MEKILYWNSPPTDTERQKLTDPHRTVMGSDLFGLEIMQALLLYSSYDTIALPAAGFKYFVSGESLHLLQREDARVSWVEDSALPSFESAPWMIIASSNPALTGLSRIRAGCNRPHTPLCGAVHSIHSPSMLRTLVFDLLMGTSSPFDTLICQSSAGKRAIEAYLSLLIERFEHAEIAQLTSAVQLSVIPEGIFVDEYAVPTRSPGECPQAPDESDTVRFLYFGRLSSLSKGDLFPLIVAFAEAHAQEPTIRLVIAGDDSQCHLAERLRKFAHSLDVGVAVDVHANPNTELKRALFRDADVFVTPSDNIQETYGRTAVEAMAARLPVIASDWDGYRDTVVHGVTGFLIPTIFPSVTREFGLHREDGNMDAPDIVAECAVIDLPALTHAMLALARNNSLRCAMGDAGYARAKSCFDWKPVIRQYEQLWERLHVEAQQLPVTRVNLYSYPPEQIFGHYATYQRAPGMAVSIHPSLTDRRLQSLLIVLDSSSCTFSRRIFEELILQFDHSPLDLDELLRRGSVATHATESSILSHVLRLVKYGLLSFVDTSEQQCDVLSQRA